MGAALEVLSLEIFRKAGHHRRADTGADKDVEHYAALAKRLVNTDMRRSEAAATRGNESNRATGQKADQAVDIDLIFKRDMMMHEGRQANEPGGGAADCTAPPVMNANEASRRGRMNLAGEGFGLRQRSRGRIATAREHDQVGLADSLARPRRRLAAAEIDHQRCGVLEFVKPVGDLGRIQAAAGKHGVEAGGIDDLGVDRGEPFTHAAIKSTRNRFAAGVDQGHGSCLRRCANRREARGLLGESPRQRREHRLDDRRGFLRQDLVGRARQHQNAGVADRNHIGCARDICEETDFADQFAGAEFGDRGGIPGSAHGQRAMQHHEQRIRGIPLRHEHLPAHEILADHCAKRLQPLFGAERPEQREVLRPVPPPKCRARSTHWRYPVRLHLQCYRRPAVTASTIRFGAPPK